jgi:serine phosphatase RsbU (regulator of sigma subunit)
MRYPLRIRHKLTLAFALVLIVQIGIVAMSARRQWQQRREDLFASHREIASAITGSLQVFLKNFVDTQQAMGIATYNGIDAPAVFHRYIAGVARANPYLMGYAIITAEGKLVSGDPNPGWWNSLRDTSDVAMVRAGRAWAVSNLQRVEDGNTVITVTTPLPQSSQLLRAAVDARALCDALNLRMRPGWRVLIVDRQGTLLYHNLDPDRPWTERDWSHDPGVQQALRTGESHRESYRSPVDHQWCLGHYLREANTGWVVGSSCPTDIAMAPLRAVVMGDCRQLAVASAVSVVLVFLLGAGISRPIERLAAAAAAIGRGEPFTSVPEVGNDEIGLLGRAFNQMALQVQERFEREHTISSTLQSAFLPQRMPECAGYLFGATYHPALMEAEVGGDFYDVFSLADGRIGLLLGDVSGKGLGAAVYASMARYMVRAYAGEDSSPGGVLDRTNRALCESIEDPAIFVTAFYAVLDTRTGTLAYANAGHWPGLLASNNTIELVGGHCLALGIVPETRYPVGRLQLRTDDQFVLFTDGLVENGAEDPMDHLEAVQRTLLRQRNCAPQQLVEQLYRDALRRSAGTLRDDVALVALRCDQQARPLRAAPPRLASRAERA